MSGFLKLLSNQNRQFAGRLICNKADPIDRFATRSAGDDNPPHLMNCFIRAPKAGKDEHDDRIRQRAFESQTLISYIYS
jgi:hypothetical protein